MNSIVPRLLRFCVILALPLSGTQGQTPLTFGMPFSVTLASDPSDVALLDLDGDGDLDVVALHAATKTLSLVHNLGAATFSPVTTLTVDVAPRGLVAGDFDLDGDLDLVTSNDAGGSISIFVNDGTPYSQLDIATPGAQVGVIAVDIDGDFDLDFVLGGGWVLINAGVGFVPATSLGLGPVGRLAAADVDGDGDADLLAVEAVTPVGFFPPLSSLKTWLNDGSGVFAAVPQVSIFARSVAFALVDLDGDGRDDVVIANDALTENVVVCRNLGGGVFLPQAYYPLAFFPSGFLEARGVSVADFDNDSDRDVAVTVWNGLTGTAGFAVFVNNGAGIFQPGPFGVGATLTTLPSTDPGVRGAAGDVTSDGVADLVYVSSAAGTFDVGMLPNTTLLMVPPPPVTLTMVDGHGQAGSVGNPFLVPLTVQATTLGGVAVQHLPITFTPQGGDSVSSGVGPALTDLFGRARVTFTAGMTPGVRNVTLSAPFAPSVVTSVYARALTINWLPAIGLFTVSLNNDRSGVPLLIAFDLSFPPPPVMPTPWGSIHVGLTGPSPFIVYLDGFGVFGPADPTLVTGPNFSRTYFVPAAAVSGIHVTSQAFGVDYAVPLPLTIVISNAVALTL